MKIPDSVRIGGIDYIISGNLGINDGEHVLYGRISFDKSVIELNPDVQEYQKKCVTLWHEIIHGIIEHANLKLGKKSERITDTIAKGVYQVLNDNEHKFFG